MARQVRCSLIQARTVALDKLSLEQIKQAMIDKHLGHIRQAAEAGAQIVCMQELFNGPYFCAEQQTRWYDFTEQIPDGPTIRLMQDVARQHHIVLIVPIYEVEQAGHLLQHRGGDRCRRHVSRQVPQDPHSACRAGILGEVLLPPGQSRLPCFRSRLRARSASTSATTATSRKVRAALGLNGAEIVFNPSATVAGLSEYLWKLEQPAHAVANGYYVGGDQSRRRRGAPWNIGEFYGSSYFCDPRGQIVAQASRDQEEVLTADLDLDMIAEVRKTWQFYRDRRPDMYESLVKA